MSTLGELTAQAAKIKDKGTSNVAELEKNQREKPWLSDRTQTFIGQIVFHLGNPDSAWMIMDWRSPTDKSWCWCEMNGSKQWFPTAAMAIEPTPRYVDPATIPAATVEKKEKAPEHIGDAVAQLLALAGALETCYKVAEKAGVDMADLHAKTDHLSNGLKRMGIGNRLRTRVKRGEFDAEAALALMKEGKWI